MLAGPEETPLVLLERGPLLRRGQHRGDERGREEEHSGVVGHHDVAGEHGGGADVHGGVPGGAQPARGLDVEEAGEHREAAERLGRQLGEIAAAAVDDDAGGAAELDAERAHPAEQHVAAGAAQLGHDHVPRLRLLRGPRVVAAVPVAFRRQGVDRRDEVGAGREEAHRQRPACDPLAGLRAPEAADVVGPVVAERAPDVLELHLAQAREVGVADRRGGAGRPQHVHDGAVRSPVGPEPLRGGDVAAGRGPGGLGGGGPAQQEYDDRCNDGMTSHGSPHRAAATRRPAPVL